MMMHGMLAIAPLAILGMGSVAVLLAGAFAPGLSRKALTLAGAGVALAAGLAAAFYVPSPELGGVAFSMIGVDSFGRLMSGLACVTALLTLLISVGYTDRRPLGEEQYPALVLFAAFGMDVLSSSVSLVGIFLGLECMALSLYTLLASNRSDPRSGEAGLKYLIIGAVSTAFFAFGLALIFVEAGTLSADGAMKALTASGSMSPLGLAGWAMLLVGLGFKTSLFPFHFWAPDVYEGGPAPVVAFLSTGSKAAVFAAFLRLAMASADGWGSLVPVLWALAAGSMVYGNLAALTQDNVKRLLAYSSIAQMGYVLLALMAAPYAGPMAALFYIVAYVAMDLGAFGVVASFSTKAAELGDIERLRGLGFVHPFRGAVLAVSMFSLAGLPPSAGFIGKFGVFYAAIKAGYVWLAVIGILTAIISVYYYLRVVVYLFLRQPAEVEPGTPGMRLMPPQDPAGRVALALITAMIVILGVLPGRLLDLLAGML